MEISIAGASSSPAGAASPPFSPPQPTAKVKMRAKESNNTNNFSKQKYYIIM
jgi:hypothetical protein